MRINVAVMGPAFPGGAFSSIFNAFRLTPPSSQWARRNGTPPIGLVP